MNIRSFLINDNTEENDSCFPSLSFNERLMGFAICVAVGINQSIKVTSSNSSPSVRF
jgi:hypothetical protein